MALHLNRPVFEDPNNATHLHHTMSSIFMPKFWAETWLRSSQPQVKLFLENFRSR